FRKFLLVVHFSAKVEASFGSGSALPAERLGRQPARANVALDLVDKAAQLTPIARPHLLEQQPSLREWKRWIRLEQVGICGCCFLVMLGPVESDPTPEPRFS